MGLVGRGVHLDFVGSDELDGPELHATPMIRFLNLRGSQKRNALVVEKFRRVVTFYGRLIAYAATAKTDVFHILWNNKVETFDRTLLMLYYRALGRKVVMTAHNVNSARRDSKDTSLNRLTLKTQYRLCDQIFVHTDRMKQELIDEFGVADTAVTVIPYNQQCRAGHVADVGRRKTHFGIDLGDKTLLAFGNIRPYKGLEYLADAFDQLLAKDPSYRLLVAGTPKPGASSVLAAGRAAAGAARAQRTRAVEHPAHPGSQDPVVLQGRRPAGSAVPRNLSKRCVVLRL